MKPFQLFSPIYAAFPIFIALLIISSIPPFSSLYAISSYDSGYDHGCDDSKISNPDNRYINQPEKGSSFHTKEFMNGYDDGFDDCSSKTTGDSNNNNNNNNRQSFTSNSNNDDRSNNNGIKQLPSKATDFPHNDQKSLDILFAKATKNSIDTYHVKGSIQNVGTNTLTNVKVTAHFYDINSNPIGITTCCYADPSDIEPGHTSSFDSFVSSDDMNGNPKYFRLSFDWSN